MMITRLLGWGATPVISAISWKLLHNLPRGLVYIILNLAYNPYFMLTTGILRKPEFFNSHWRGGKSCCYYNTHYTRPAFPIPPHHPTSLPTSPHLICNTTSPILHFTPSPLPTTLQFSFFNLAYHLPYLLYSLISFSISLYLISIIISPIIQYFYILISLSYQIHSILLSISLFYRIFI